MARVTVTVPDEVLETWRACAEVQGSSLSGLVAEWMSELEPGLRDVVRLGQAMKQADAAQREALRGAVNAAAETVQGPLVDAWAAWTAAMPDPQLSNRGVR